MNGIILRLERIDLFPRKADTYVTESIQEWNGIPTNERRRAIRNNYPFWQDLSHQEWIQAGV